MTKEEAIKRVAKHIGREPCRRHLDLLVAQGVISAYLHNGTDTTKVRIAFPMGEWLELRDGSWRMLRWN